MAAPVPFPTPAMWQGTLLFNGPRAQGFSETYYMYITFSTDPYLAAENAMKDLIAVRRQFMPSQWVIQACRISDTTIRGDADLVEQPDLNLGPGPKAELAAPANAGWQLRLEEVSYQVHETRLFRAWTQQATGQTSLSDGTPTPEAVIWSQNMANKLINGKTGSGYTVKFGIRSFIRPGIDPAIVPVQSVQLDSAGRIQLVITRSQLPAAWAAGKEIQVTVPKRRCVTGVSGRHRIKHISTSGDPATVTLQSTLCCGQDDLLGLSGNAFLIVVAFYPIRWVTLARPGSRKTGRAFFVPRGRQSSQCC